MTTGQRCACGRELPPAWPRADACGCAVCNECWDHESEHAILYGDPTAPKPRGILLTTERGGLVLDPFCGSGSTGIAAQMEGRRFIGMEREASWCEVARAEISGTLFAEATA